MTELESRPEVPILIKRRDLVSLNDIDTYLAQLKSRVQDKHTEAEEPEK